MSRQYQQFIFKRYVFDRESRRLELYYTYDDDVEFHESYHFDFDFVDYDEAVLDRALQTFFFMAGVSYYKVFLAPEIIVQAGEIDSELSGFLSKTYRRGLGEFFYVNQLDPRTTIDFPATSNSFKPLASELNGLLVGVGGGKDSLVSIDLLQQTNADTATWSLNHRPQLTPLVERIGSQHYWVERQFDPQLLKLKDSPDAYNGHIPISAIFACVGTIVAILTGRRDVVVSNESSANESTLHYQGVPINHQYSKSLEFEIDYQTLLAHCFGDSPRYYSFLRPLSELRIAELFAKSGFERYKDVFSSCNRAFAYGNTQIFWDGTCSKCAFVFLALTPFVDRAVLESLFSGKNLLLDPELEPTYRQLLGIEGDKPLECVGEIKESRAAMRLAQTVYPELEKYQFDLPEDYDFRSLSNHRLPDDIFRLFEAALR